MQLLVLGMHRSGTSLLVRTLEGLGLWAGSEHDFNPPTAHDPEGHREHRLVWGLNESALAWIDRAWDNPYGIDWSRLSAGHRADVLGAINVAVDTLGHHPDWVAKDPRLSLTLPLWREIIRPPVIIVHRDPLEVARSLHSRDGLPIPAGLAMWEAYTRQAITNSEGLDRLLLDHAELVTHPARTTAQLDEWLASRRASPRPHQHVGAPVHDDLVRHRSTPAETAALLDPQQQRLLAAIVRATADPDAEALSSLSSIAAEPGLGHLRERD